MIYSIFANRDATIYERQYTMNTGIDPLLELSHETPGSGSSIYNSRILLKFDVSDIESRVNAGKISQNAQGSPGSILFAPDSALKFSDV